MAFCFFTPFEIWDVFLLVQDYGKVEINNKKENEIKINNLEATRDLSIITKKKKKNY